MLSLSREVVHYSQEDEFQSSASSSPQGFISCQASYISEAGASPIATLPTPARSRLPVSLPRAVLAKERQETRLFEDALARAWAVHEGAGFPHLLGALDPNGSGLQQEDARGGATFHSLAPPGSRASTAGRQLLQPLQLQSQPRKQQQTQQQQQQAQQQQTHQQQQRQQQSSSSSSSSSHPNSLSNLQLQLPAGSLQQTNSFTKDNNNNNRNNSTHSTYSTHNTHSAYHSTSTSASSGPGVGRGRMRAPPSKHRVVTPEEEDDADCSLQFNLLKELFVSPVLKRLGLSGKNERDDGDEEDDEDDDDDEGDKQSGPSGWAALCFPAGTKANSRETAEAIDRVARVNDELQF